MKYYIFHIGTKFCFPKKNEMEVVEKIQKKYGCETNNIEGLFQIFDWEFIDEDDDYLIDLYFLGEVNKPQYLELFKTIAPFIPKGCYIQMIDQEASMWRWVFDGKDVLTVYPKIIWPTLEESKNRTMDMGI
jgi:hypothetical protein